jgi:hypothetical protein
MRNHAAPDAPPMRLAYVKVSGNREPANRRLAGKTLPGRGAARSGAPQIRDRSKLGDWNGAGP